jgi:sulfate/thiosulfate transport system substrate-binding protein
MSIKWSPRGRATAGAAACLAVLAVLALLATSACAPGGASTISTSGSGAGCKPAKSPVLTLAAYSTPYDAYGKLISAWQKEWAAAHNKQQVIFQTSFGGSTTQAQNVASGFPADIVALSLVPDVQIIQKAGLITHDWTKDTGGGIVATTPVALDVRPGNPKHITNWNDLTKPGLKILTPDPSQSGGAKWNIVAAYGAAQRGKVPGYTANSQSSAQSLLTGIFKNVTVMDKSANDSLKNFQSGNGDVAISYENQILLSKAGGTNDQLVVPPSTVLVQNPTVVVDKNAQKHCVLPIANAFVNWLHGPEAQEIFAKTGYFRPVDPTQAQKGSTKLGQAPLTDVFTTDQIEGWNQLINNTVFGPDGAFTQALKAAKG